jgi:hypothetical protein
MKVYPPLNSGFSLPSDPELLVAVEPVLEHLRCKLFR